MTRTRALCLLLSSAIAVSAAGCASTNSRQVGITKNQELVSGCQNLGDVSIGQSVASTEIDAELAQAGEKKGADYVVVASDGARTGTAYRCTTPSASAPAAR
jgi:hypothetical protein